MSFYFQDDHIINLVYKALHTRHQEYIFKNILHIGLLVLNLPQVNGISKNNMFMKKERF